MDISSFRNYGELFNIFVKLSCGTISIYGANKMPISVVKQQVMDHLRIEDDNNYGSGILIYMGKPLENNNNTLEYYAINPESTIFFIFKVYGG